jgi:hypothetical protein
MRRAARITVGRIALFRGIILFISLPHRYNVGRTFVCRQYSMPRARDIDREE